MGHVRFVEAGDYEYIASRMRNADIREVHAYSGMSPIDGLRFAFKHSGLACTVVGENPCAMFGVVPLDDETGSVWLLGTDELTATPLRREFLRKGRGFVDNLHNYRPLLSGFIDERNTLHVTWLKRLGFTIINRHPKFGFEQRPFLEFVRLRT